MDISKVEESAGTCGAEALKLNAKGRCCLFFREEVCLAPKMRFAMCRGCIRVSVKAAVSSLLDNIRELTLQLFPPKNEEEIYPEERSGLGS